MIDDGSTITSEAYLSNHYTSNQTKGLESFLVLEFTEITTNNSKKKKCKDFCLEVVMDEEPINNFRNIVIEH